MNFRTQTKTPSLTRRGFIALSGLMLTGCGWHLRGIQDVPIESIYVDLGINSAIGATIKRNLAARTSIKVINDKDEAEAIFHLTSFSRGTSILAYNSDGQARVYSLILSGTFNVKTANGAEILPPTTVSTTREMTWDESDYNGKAQEEQLMFTDMESVVISKIINRLAHITKEQVEQAKINGL